MTARAATVAVLALLVAVSAVSVIYSKHESRRLFSLLEQENRTRDALDAEWGMLQLEQAAWATHGRVERVAREELDMKLPDRDEVNVLR
ncbi:MAG: cell division protein FtsL [Ectothiorhodospiraceae bacterium]|nr:cell division protein FtsL [Ectothiorhodospiraceae bacterium]